MVTVVSSWLVATAVSMLVTTGPVRPDALWAAMLAATAAASHGVPLWKTRLGRRVMVQTV